MRGVIDLLIIAAAFVLLIKSADWLVDSSSSIGVRLHVSQLVIGLTVVAFGTSAPELIVNLIAAVKGHSGITVGNILGSNIVNICAGLGIASLFVALNVRGSTKKVELPFLLGSVGALAVLASNGRFWRLDALYQITKPDGAVLLLCFSLYMLYVYLLFRKHKARQDVPEASTTAAHIKPSKSLAVDTLKLVGSGVLLFISGDIVVDRAVILATRWGVPQGVIGASIVALGTSLPELVATVVAAYKKNHDIAIGTIVGSNIFNILWVLGLSGLVAAEPIEMSNDLLVDFAVMAAASVYLHLSALAKGRLTRIDGLVLVPAYVAYAYYLAACSK